MRRRTITEEEKVVRAIAKLVNNLELDLEMVGKYLTVIVGRVTYNRLKMIIESAEYERNNI
jgi:hypothetical protein